MKITDITTITELSDLIHKSRPTVYKWISAYERGKKEEVPNIVAQLFDMLCSGRMKKSELYAYCEQNFYKKSDNAALDEVIDILRKNREILDFNKIKKIIEKELENELRK